MSLPHFSRRWLLCALPTALLAWLFPRPRRAAAAPRRRILPASLGPSQPCSVITYSYDAMHRFTGVAEHLAFRGKSRSSPPVRLVQVTSYSYDIDAPE